MMHNDIGRALGALRHVIDRAKGPVFTDADFGRTLLAFLDVCNAMAEKDRQFKARAAEAERIAKAAEVERRRQKSGDDLKRLLDELGSALDD
jgi:hypothetical protein